MEIESIVAAAKQPFKLRRDISQQFRVSTQLVSLLIREAYKQPEKLRAKKHRDSENTTKRKAIERAVTNMLSANKQIVRATQV